MTKDQLLDAIANMTVLELSELVKAMEEKFGVSAAPVAVAGAPAASAAPVVEEKDEFTVVLVNAGAKKIDVIKVVREITGLGLAESKAIVDAGNKVLKESVPKKDADEMKKKLEAAGASVELK
ncbi:MAG: 50S ribosomal protein L7/L12 [Spirochaetes bacterium GWD1_27_9]|nr:MAG: 50S ribosomal protein L7/L12 [Spirochaetes bacterium GWB1_27_13]OHD21050.1 MAG: 50S ribosomal protein L7/L12 [Spirochaetes bacterium GWC1_27_15]OHD45412.1 MAG: 50S ribosomal protein L7/L12 [Spirochaetes bacterium GWD1_27_9]